jgi:hypothetical protein
MSKTEIYPTKLFNSKPFGTGYSTQIYPEDWLTDSRDFEHYKHKIAASSALVELGPMSNGYFLVSVLGQEKLDLPDRRL